MRIERVVEVEHPGVDMAEGAGGSHINILSSSSRTSVTTFSTVVPDKRTK
jgi:hypothetical protein